MTVWTQVLRIFAACATTMPGFTSSAARERAPHVARRTGRSALAVAVLLGFVVAGTITAVAPPAQALVHNLFPADEFGFPTDRFRADEALFVTLTSDIEGGTVCVVSAEVTDPTTADCAEPAWASAKRYVGMGTLLGYPFHGGSKHMLRPGKWRLLGTPNTPPDEGDLVTQAAIRLGLNNQAPPKGTELSEVFTVVSCSPTCDTSVADAQLAPWKAMASRAVPKAAAENTALAMDIASRTQKIASAFYGGVGFGMAWGLMAAGWAGLNFDFVVPSTQDIAKRVHKRLSDDVRAMWAGIAADPPDPNFDTVAEPAFTTVEQVSADATTTGLQARYLNAWFDAQMRASAIGDTSRIASERYQGAVIAGNHKKAALQADAAAGYSFELRNELRNMKIFGSLIAQFDWVGEPVVTAPDGQDPTVWWAEMLTELEDLTAADLTAEDQQRLLDQGLTRADIDDVLAMWSAPDWRAQMQAVDPTATLRQTMLDSIGDIDDQLDTLAQFGSWMSMNAADETARVPGEQPNQAPLSTFTASAVTGEAPLTVTFTSTASDPDGDALSLRWDIAGVRRATGATTVTHTFTEPGNYGVSLVADDGDLWHQSVKWIEVRPAGWDDGDNRAPVALFTPTVVEGNGPITQTFGGVRWSV